MAKISHSNPFLDDVFVPRKKMKKGQKMPFKDALDLVDDDLPDGAYWAMAHEIAGLEYGDGFDELYGND